MSTRAVWDRVVSDVAQYIQTEVLQCAPPTRADTHVGVTLVFQSDAMVCTTDARSDILSQFGVATKWTVHSRTVRVELLGGPVTSLRIWRRNVVKRVSLTLLVLLWIFYGYIAFSLHPDRVTPRTPLTP